MTGTASGRATGSALRAGVGRVRVLHPGGRRCRPLQLFGAATVSRRRRLERRRRGRHRHLQLGHLDPHDAVAGRFRTFQVFGAANDTPVVGDWNGDGVDEIGVFRSSANTFYFAVPAVDGRDTVESVAYPAIRHLPVVGDWDSNGTDSEGVVTIG